LADCWIQPAGEDRMAYTLDWCGFASAHTRQLTKQFFGQEQDVQHGSAGTSFPLLPVSTSIALPRSNLAQTLPQTPPKADESFSQPETHAGEAKNKRHVFVVTVGISRYAQESINLKYARDDARAMMELFRQRGPQQYGEVHGQEILDEQATKKKILDALHEVTRKARSEDVLVVFLAGHGKMVGQRYYFLTHEFQRQKDLVDDDIRVQGLPADELGDALASVPVLQRILILDTCASGGALGLARKGRDPFAFRERSRSWANVMGPLRLQPRQPEKKHTKSTPLATAC